MEFINNVVKFSEWLGESPVLIFGLLWCAAVPFLGAMFRCTKR